MPERIENRMAVDSEWEWKEKEHENIGLPRCECCGEKIKQSMALHILSGKKGVWICDRCIEDLKEVTGW